MLQGTNPWNAMPGHPAAMGGAFMAPLDPLDQTLIDKVVAGDEAVQCGATAVFSPSMDLAWEGAAGLADP